MEHENQRGNKPKEGIIICKRCGQEKNMDQYYKGYRICKDCVREKGMERRKRYDALRDERTCRVCGQSKSTDQFYPRDTNVHGYDYLCKQCRRARDYDPDQARMRRMRYKIDHTTKVCARCGQEYTLNRFSNSHRDPTGYSPLCRSCERKE